MARIEASRDLDGAAVGPSDAPATIVIVFASWCPHCKDELRVLDAVRSAHRVRVLGVNYREHEDYDGRGGPAAVRAFARDVPWLRVVPIGDDVFAQLGSPPLIPTLFVYDHAGALIATFDRRDRPAPDRAELDALLAHLGS
jgi:thiol-disulfide isomerase/thioredoxin